MSKSIVAAVIAVAAGLIASTAAEARGRHHHHHHRHVFLYRAPIIVTRVPVVDCSYAFARWQATGSYRWKHRYFACKGW